MYNILLTDDEKIVTDSLTMILNKNFAEQVKIFTANSGTKALEEVRSKNIDILFMDISMPGLSGLEAVSLIKQMNPNIIVIILTAYDKFQYAQQALNMGAFKYLTKPVNRNLIIQTVRDAMNAVDDERGKQTDSIKLHQKLNVVSPMVESDFIYSCIFNNGNTDFTDYLDYFGITDSDYFFACLEVPDTAPNNRGSVYEKIREILSSKCRCIIGSFMGNRVTIFFPLASGGMDSFSEKIQHELMGELFTLLSIQISAKIKIGVSGIEHNIEDAQKAYNAASVLLNKIDSSGGIEFSGLQNIQQGNSQTAKPAQKLLTSIRLGDSANAGEYARECATSILAEHKDEPDKIKGALFELVIQEKNAVVELNPSYKNPAIDSAFSFFEKTDSVQEQIQYLAERSMECALEIQNLKSQTENPIIKKALVYIEEHLADLQGLEPLAQTLNVSPFYLSKLFKEETGDTFINYLTSMRLEKAKKLLKDSSMIIKEITAGVGYNDQNYFSKLFKQRFGVSPTEYRAKATSN